MTEEEYANQRHVIGDYSPTSKAYFSNGILECREFMPGDCRHLAGLQLPDHLYRVRIDLMKEEVEFVDFSDDDPGEDTLVTHTVFGATLPFAKYIDAESKPVLREDQDGMLCMVLPNAHQEYDVWVCFGQDEIQLHQPGIFKLKPILEVRPFKTLSMFMLVEKIPKRTYTTLRQVYLDEIEKEAEQKELEQKELEMKVTISTPLGTKRKAPAQPLPLKTKRKQQFWPWEDACHRCKGQCFSKGVSEHQDQIRAATENGQLIHFNPRSVCSFWDHPMAH